MSELSYKELQEMIPDYVFEQLTITEAKTFENAIKNYPDLIQEVSEAKAVFGKIKKIDITNEIEHKSRNIIVKVNQKLRDNPKRRKLRTFSRLVMPTAALAIIAAMVVLYDSELFVQPNDVQHISDNSDINELFEFKNSEKIAILEVAEDENAIIEAAENIDFNSRNIMIENIEEIEIKLEQVEIEFLNEKLSQLNQKSLSGFYDSQFHFGSTMYKDIENLTETEFQNLLEDIENEEII